jgi:ribosome biogenesis protein BRX1
MAPVYKTLTKQSKTSAPADGPKSLNKQRVLIISSRGITHRHRHLLQDLASVLPHGRREPKFDSKKRLYELNELAQLYNCNNVLFFEARKGQDLYMYLARVPNGPTHKFHVQNLHTMEELQFTGNCLKGSRPILSFDGSFDSLPHLQLVKAQFTQVFGVPPGARKSKPFIDHVLAFSWVDGRVWIRHYQINEEESALKKETEVSLVEIGPRKPPPLHQ